MGSSEWRVVGGEEPDGPEHAQPTIRLRLGEILPLLETAARRNASWLADLADDEIIVSSDLAQVLYRYQQMIQEKSA